MTSKYTPPILTDKEIYAIGKEWLDTVIDSQGDDWSSRDFNRFLVTKQAEKDAAIINELAEALTRAWIFIEVVNNTLPTNGGLKLYSEITDTLAKVKGESHD